MVCRRDLHEVFLQYALDFFDRYAAQDVGRMGLLNLMCHRTAAATTCGTAQPASAP